MAHRFQAAGVARSGGRAGCDDQRRIRSAAHLLRPARVLSRDSLLDLTQGRNAGSFERSIDVLVSRIRRKIEPDPQAATMIKTVRSGGYMFTPKVEAISVEAVTAAGH